MLFDLKSWVSPSGGVPIGFRDGKKGKLQVNDGLLTNPRGIPVAVSVFKGNSKDPKTLLPQVDKLRQ